MRYTIYLMLLLTCSTYSAEPVYTWHATANDPDRVYLYRDGKQIGGWCCKEKHYRPLDGETWGEPSASAPVALPVRALPTTTVTANGRRRSGRIEYKLSDKDAEWIGNVVGEAAGKAAGEMLQKLEQGLYPADLLRSAELFTHLEMGGKVDDKTDRADAFFSVKDHVDKGGTSIFVSERAKFVAKLKDEDFTNPVLAKMTIEFMDGPQARKESTLKTDETLQVAMQLNAEDWREKPATTTANTPSVLIAIKHKDKEAAEKNPVTVHCAFEFKCLKEGRSVTKIMQFDLYLEKLKFQTGVGLYYHWQVKNVEYK